MKKKGIFVGLTLAGALLLGGCGDTTDAEDKVKLRSEAERVDWYNEVTTTGDNTGLRQDLIEENQEITRELTGKVLNNVQKSQPLAQGFMAMKESESGGVGHHPVFRGRVLTSYMDVGNFLKEETRGITERRHLDKDGIYQGLLKFEGVTLAENLSSRGGFERVPGATILSGHEGLNNFLGFDRHGDAQIEIEPNTKTDMQKYVRIINRASTGLKDTKKEITYKDIEKVKGKGFGIKHTEKGTPVYADNYVYSVNRAIGTTLQPLSNTLIYNSDSDMDKPIPVMLMEDDWRATQRLYAFLSLTGTDVANQIYGSLKDGNPTGVGLRGLKGSKLELQTRHTSDGYIVFRIDKYNGKRDLTDPKEIERYKREIEMLENYISSIEVQQYLVHPDIEGVGYASKIVVNGESQEVNNVIDETDFSRLTMQISAFGDGISEHNVPTFRKQLEEDDLSTIRGYLDRSETYEEAMEQFWEAGITDPEYITYIQLAVLGFEREVMNGEDLTPEVVNTELNRLYKNGEKYFRNHIKPAFLLSGVEGDEFDTYIEDYIRVYNLVNNIEKPKNNNNKVKEKESEALSRFNINVLKLTGIAPIYGIES